MEKHGMMPNNGDNMDIFKRRSVRTFSDKIVDNEIVIKMIKDAVQAPSARNQQPWEFIILDDCYKEEIMKMSNGAKSLKEANKIVAFVMNLAKSNPEYAPIDMSGVVNYFMLSGVKYNVGCIWIGTYPILERVEYANKLLGIEKPYSIFAFVGIGYPKEDDFKYLERETKIHIGKW